MPQLPQGGKVPGTRKQTAISILKILDGRLQYYENQGLPDTQAGFRKGRGTRDQITNIHWIVENKGISEEKKNLSLFH